MTDNYNYNCDCECADRVKELEQTVEELTAEFETELEELTREVRMGRQKEFRPRMDRIEEAAGDSDDARRERAELRAKMEMIFGVDDERLSAPKKRAQDLRHALIRRADAKTDANAGRISMHYKDVQDLFASIGHGLVHAPECYQAMDDAAYTDGFEKSEKIKDGQPVTAICLDIGRLPDGVAVREITNGEPTRTGTSGIISGDNTTKD